MAKYPFHCICGLYILIHSSVDGHLGCLQVLTIVKSDAVNIRVNVSFWIVILSGYKAFVYLGRWLFFILRRNCFKNTISEECLVNMGREINNGSVNIKSRSDHFHLIITVSLVITDTSKHLCLNTLPFHFLLMSQSYEINRPRDQAPARPCLCCLLWTFCIQPALREERARRRFGDQPGDSRRHVYPHRTVQSSVSHPQGIAGDVRKYCLSVGLGGKANGIQ